MVTPVDVGSTIPILPGYGISAILTGINPPLDCPPEFYAIIKSQISLPHSVDLIQLAYLRLLKDTEFTIDVDFAKHLLHYVVYESQQLFEISTLRARFSMPPRERRKQWKEDERRRERRSERRRQKYQQYQNNVINKYSKLYEQAGKYCKLFCVYIFDMHNIYCVHTSIITSSSSHFILFCCFLFITTSYYYI